MQLSKKLKIFSETFTAFLKSTFNFEHLQKKNERRSLCISEVIVGKRRSYINA